MQIFRFSVNLRLRHPTIDPKVIGASLGIHPSREWRVGDARSTPTGYPLEGVYTETYWSSKSIRGVDDELIDTLEKLLSILESSGAFLKTFIDSDGRVEVYVSWFSSNRSGGTTIRSELLKRFADLGVDLSLDVYGH